MSNEKMREEFEVWWRSEMNLKVMDLHRCSFPMTDDIDQPYACHETNRGWMAWQASRAAVVVDLEPDEPADEGSTYLHQDFVKSCIEAAGLKVKP